MKNRNLVIVILAVICAGLLAGVVYTVTKGKSGTQKKQEASAEAGADETESQSGIIEEDGKKYKLNPDIKTVLFMGVDKEEKADLGNNPGENGQSDSLNLLVLNKEEKTAQIIQISRDSMVGIDIYDVTGNRLMTENGQIALQYAYGDGAEESCRLTSEKVSELMYGVNVDSYFSLTLRGWLQQLMRLEELLLPCQKIIQLLILHLKKVQKLLLMGNLLKNMSVKEILKSLTVTISAWNVSHSLWML